MAKTGLLIFALLAVLTNKCRSQQCPCKDALQFAGDNTEEYGIARGLEEPLTVISSCFWINMPEGYEQDHLPTVISYTFQGGHILGNDFVIWVGRNGLIMQRQNVLFEGAPVPIKVADGTDHHLCATWDLSAGNIKLYLDGNKRFEVKRQKYVTGNLPAGGTWIIGQDQDKFEGGFEITNSMKGMLAEVNVWDRMLCPYEIAALASSCGPIIKGNIKAHNDFAIKGGLTTFKPACCLRSCQKLSISYVWKLLA